MISLLQMPALFKCKRGHSTGAFKSDTSKVVFNHWLEDITEMIIEIIICKKKKKKRKKKIKVSDRRHST